MNFEKLQRYQAANEPLAATQYAWPLFGAGLENLGENGAPVIRPIPAYSDEELLMRIDAVSLCYTDLKEITQGPNHPRLKDRDLKTDPIVPGHELSMTVVGVGEKLCGQYKVGERYTMQPDVWVDGKSVPFCFGMDGAYRQYAKMDQRILNGDAGNYLIPVPNEMTYAAIAITEPWACVEASYRMEYRTAFKTGGAVWVLGGANARPGYQVDAQWVAGSKPKSITVSDIPADLEQTLLKICEQGGIDFTKKTQPEIEASGDVFDDILLLDCEPQDVRMASKYMNKGSILALINDKPMSGQIEIDLGRLHYDDVVAVGTTSRQISEAYTTTPVRSELKPDGIAWIMGAGGPLGRMHLQRAIESKHGPKTIVTSNVTPKRFEALREFFTPLAEKHHKEIIFTNPVADPQGYADVMREIKRRGGFDDIEVMLILPEVIAAACEFLAPRGVVNVFAGMKRGVKMTVDPWMIYGEKQNRLVGHSGSGLDDQKAVVSRCVDGQLQPDLSVAAVGGLKQIPEGVQAMKDSVFPGKIVIYPQILDLPLTPLSDLKEKYPEVYDNLGASETWSMEAEKAFLESGLS